MWGCYVHAITLVPEGIAGGVLSPNGNGRLYSPGSRVNGVLEPLEATWMTAFVMLFAVIESIVRLPRLDLGRRQ